jgi:hypothetical protein
MCYYIIDTNVCIAANNRDCPQADNQCVLNCIIKLEECLSILKEDIKGSIFIDSGNEIISEYMKYLCLSGQPGVGDLFFKELYNMQGKESCKCINITIDAKWGYKEFPHDDELTTFDRSDRKFVAVAIASESNPTILNATDSDWKEHFTVLHKNGLKIRNLCPNCLK